MVKIRRAMSGRWSGLFGITVSAKYRISAPEAAVFFLSLAFLLSLHVRIAWLAFSRILSNMGAYYDEIEIEDMVWDAEKRLYHYPCPCGDRFEISRQQLANYEDIATCPSCSLIIRVIYDPVSRHFVS